MQLVSARKKGREYSVDERGGTLYIHTNDEHPNFRVATADIKAPEAWKTLIPGSDENYITGLSVFRDYFVLESHEKGVEDRMRVGQDKRDEVRVDRGGSGRIENNTS